MVQVVGMGRAVDQLKSSLRRGTVLAVTALVVVGLFYGSCTARVLPNEFGIEQRKFGSAGIASTVYGPGLYFVGPGVTMHTFPREIHVLEASYDREEAIRKGGPNL